MKWDQPMVFHFNVATYVLKLAKSANVFLAIFVYT